MSFHFRCPHCNAKLEAEDDWVGLETSCPQCNQNITIAPATPPEKTKDQSTPVTVPSSVDAQPCGNTFIIRQEQHIVTHDQSNPMMQQNTTAHISGKSTASLVLGIINCLMWLLPIIGIPLGIIGLVLGCYKKYNIGILLNAITLAAAVVNCIIGAILGAQGKLF